jgi:hypothetical protein
MTPQIILVDAHVHIHGCFDLKTFFDSAMANFKRAAAIRNVSDFWAALLLTETTGANWFRHLSYFDNGSLFASNSVKSWTIHPTEERCSLRVESDKGKGMFIIAGRQIRTAEDLEVLALITERKFEDGLPLREVIRNVTKSEAIPVIPWGFGKWTGRRGEIIKRTLEDTTNSDLFLGDNGGRPSFLPRPSPFDLAESKGIKVLPGSDPLPFASEYWRPGSFGFWVEGSVDAQRPGKSIRRILLDSSLQINPYGALEKPLRFILNQAAMQILKRRRKRDLGNQ